MAERLRRSESGNALSRGKGKYPICIFAVATAFDGACEAFGYCIEVGSVDVSLSLVLSFKSDAERTLSEEFAAYNLYSRWLGENLNAGLFYFEFSFFGTYSTCTNKVPVYFTAESIEIMPTEITLDDTDLII